MPKRRPFSPLPSASHDNATIEMNNRNYQSLVATADDSFFETSILSTNEPVEVDEPATEETTTDEPRQTVDELLEIIEVDDSIDDQDCVVVDVDAIVVEDGPVLGGIRRQRKRAVPRISSDIVTVDDSHNDDVIHDKEVPLAFLSIGRLLYDGLWSLLRGSDSSTQPEPRPRRRRLSVEAVATVDLTAASRHNSPLISIRPLLPSPDSKTILEPSPPPPTLPPPPTPIYHSGLGECPICLETLTSPMSTLCGHVFCRECLTNIMKNDKRCPTCRKAIKKNGFHPIYF